MAKLTFNQSSYKWGRIWKQVEYNVASSNGGQESKTVKYVDQNNVTNTLFNTYYLVGLNHSEFKF